MRCVQPPVGECDLRHLDLPGVLGQAPRARCAPQVSAAPRPGAREARAPPSPAPHAPRGVSTSAPERLRSPAQGDSWSGPQHSSAPSFVRSATMDKWKDVELEKMRAGGNAKFRQFLESQEDYDPCWSLQDKYSSKAAALFRDRVRPSLPFPTSLHQ